MCWYSILYVLFFSPFFRIYDKKVCFMIFRSFNLGVKNVEVDLSNQVVRILGSTSVKTMTEALEQTGRKARLIGQGVPEGCSFLSWLFYKFFLLIYMNTLVLLFFFSFIVQLDLYVMSHCASTKCLLCFHKATKEEAIFPFIVTLSDQQLFFCVYGFILFFVFFFNLFISNKRILLI